MGVQTEIDRISAAVQNAHLKVLEKGGTTAAPYLVANLEAAIDTIPEATEPTLQSKSVTPSESAQTVKPDSGYDGLSSVAVGAISKTYVGSSVPKQAAQTITPGTANKTIASGKYLTGAQTIKGDANLIPGNIKSGVSIFGVNGSYEGSGGSGGGSELKTCTIVVDNQIASKGYGLLAYGFTTVENGELEYNVYNGIRVDQSVFTFENVLCGSFFHIVRAGSYSFATSNGLNECTLVGCSSGDPSVNAIAPTEAGVVSTWTIYDDD